MLERAGFELLMELRMPSNWYFFEVLAKESGMSNRLISQIKVDAPDFSKRIDVLLDSIAFDQNLSFSVQIIARKK